LLTQQRNELALLQDQLAQRNLQLEAANAELRSLDEMKSMFLGVAAHELRTPLASILGFAELLLEESGPAGWTETQLQFLHIIQRNAGRLLEIANNLLDVTRLAAGRMEVDLQPHDLGGLVEQLVAEYRPRAAAQSHQLSLAVAAPLPPALCDVMRATQIMGNLLDNATKYTPAGGAIHVCLRRADEAGFLQFSVADTGIGIPEQDQGHLFDSFYRARNSGLTKASGAGLGLHIVAALVELHGGRVWVQSQLGQGSTFYVTFPVSDD
jgi:signal transduction histidine kinase